MSNASSPWRNFVEFVAAARDKPGSINYGSGEPGSLGHLTAELMQVVAGFGMQHVPYKGSSPAQADLLSGQIHATSDAITSHVAMVKAGRLRILGIAVDRRLESLPDLPAFAEQGYPGVAATAWFGLNGAGKSAPEIRRLPRRCRGRNRWQSSPNFGLSIEPSLILPAAFTPFVRSEVERWGGVVKDRNIRVN